MYVYDMRDLLGNDLTMRPARSLACGLVFESAYGALCAELCVCGDRQDRQTISIRDRVRGWFEA